MQGLFELHRDVDHSGVSGVGVVAEGCVFADGSCAMHWLNDLTSWAVYQNVDDLRAIHGHGGATRLVFNSFVPAQRVGS